MNKLPKILALGACVLASSAAVSAVERPVYEQDKVILHAWTWSLDTIANNMKLIADAGYDLVQRIPGLPALARIALIACGAFAVSWAVVRLMQRWSVTRRLVE